MAERYWFQALPLRGFAVGFSWRVMGNTQPGWRGWLANRLRRLAQRVDGALTLGITIETSPPLHPRRNRQVIDFAVQAIERAVASEARDAAVDLALTDTYPELARHD